ncbi:MAG TPA: methyltransferase domain-containing protein [Gaiellales bacterium]|jgi:SAM-dependent methyltransferase|nr:methyltransferase domain-containing protein [Gaiellales bacterium]
MDFAALAGGYDELRPAGESWRELASVELAELGPAARVLDVGCGTGRFAVFAAERLGARVWGVDPSPEMLAQARRRGGRRVGWKQAAAEHLPFKDGWFDAAHAHLVMHLVDDIGAALSEMARVLSPGGRLVVVSFRAEHFDRFHLNLYFPTLAGIDRARFPDPAALSAAIGAAGFHDVAERALHQQVTLAPEAVLERVRGRYISTLHLLDEQDYRVGLARLEQDLAGRERPLTADLFWSITTATRA